MIITGRRWYDRYGAQCVAGRMLLLFSRGTRRELRALVRRVRLEQCGHFMMGRLILKSTSARAENDTTPEYIRLRYPAARNVGDGYYDISVSGTYGDDGLPIDANDYPGLWDHLHPVPVSLADAFWSGGGHNSCGAEGLEFQRWAKENANRLSRLQKAR